MKKLVLWLLFFLLPFLYSVYLSAQPGKERDCSSTCFSSEVVSVKNIAAGCAEYELRVSYNGDCAHALSHFTVAVPCGTIEHLWNSQQWAQEIGTDPTTGLSGFKIDNTANFGEGPLQSFTVRFTVCASSETCAAQLSCWQPLVAYKAATCVNFETLTVPCKRLEASLEKTDVSCFGAADATLSAVVTDGQEPYSFEWSDGATEPSRTGLSAGDYTVTVRDASGAEVVLGETIQEPEVIVLDASSSPASCNGLTDGALDLTISGGTSPYTVAWSNGSATEDLDTLAPGQYTVVATDATGCTTTARFTVGTTSSIDINGIVQKPDCNTANGSIDITATGGTAPYSFQWSNGEASEDLQQIGTGLYTVTVTDNAGCSQNAAYFVKDTNTLAVKGIVTPATCTEATGAVDITVTGGTAPYSYAWSNGETTEDLLGLPSGSYTVLVTDSKGCTTSATFGIPKSTFQVQRTVVQPSCHGEEDGSITVEEPIGGTAPYTYEWSTGDTDPSVTNLGPGTYSVTVTDATGCSRTLTSMLTEPSEIAVEAIVSSASCNEDGSFSIDLNVSGGTAPYAYQWSDGSTASSRDNLSQGVYSVTITDARGCSITREIVVEGQPAAWSCLISELTSAPVCGSTGNAISTPVLDADNYYWSVESTDGSWSLTGDDSPSATYTAGGENSTATFTLTIIKDGCQQTCSYTVTSCSAGGGVTEPGGEEPGDGDQPDDGDDTDSDTPGEQPQPGDGGDQTCEECFDTAARLVAEEGDCSTYEMTVSTTGMCRHELSHWTLSIPCGVVTNYWNSEGWAMEFGKDPTTGLYGLKVDGVNAFGKSVDSFKVRFTLCRQEECDAANWQPMVAYKAGQCVGYESVPVGPSLTTATTSVYPNPFEEEIHFEWSGDEQNADLVIIDQYGNTVMQCTKPGDSATGVYALTVEAAELPRGMYYYRLNVGGKIFNGKISKR